MSESLQIKQIQVRVVKKAEEKKLAGLVNSPKNLGILKFENNVVVKPKSKPSLKPSQKLFDTTGIISSAKRKTKSLSDLKRFVIYNLPGNRSNKNQPEKNYDDLEKFKNSDLKNANRNSKNVHQLEKTGRKNGHGSKQRADKDLKVLDRTEWDTRTLDKVSKNAARWIVHEKMHGEGGDEKSNEQRDRLYKHVTTRYGEDPSTTQLLPEIVSETDIPDFLKSEEKIPVDEKRNSIKKEIYANEEENKITLGEFAKNPKDVYSFLESNQEEVLNRTAENIIIIPRKLENPPLLVDLLNSNIPEQYLYDTSNDFETKLLSGSHTAQYRSNARNRDVVSFQAENENKITAEYNIKMEKVYPKEIDRRLGTCRGLLRWKSLPIESDGNTTQMQLLPIENVVQEEHVDSEQIIFMKPIIQIACEYWQYAWASAGQWHDLTILELRRSLNHIQDCIRQTAITALALSIIHGRKARGLSDNTELILPVGIKENIIDRLEDLDNRVKLGACLCIYSIPLPMESDRIYEVLIKCVDECVDFQDKLLASTILILSSHPIKMASICSIVIKGYFLQPQPYLLTLLSLLSSQSGDLVHSVSAEYLNSCVWEERSGACTILGNLEPSNLRSAIIEKMIFLAWNDKKLQVRKAALSALGRVGCLDQVHEFIQQKLLTDLQDETSAESALEFIVEMGVITEQILPIIVKCFSSELGRVRSAVCRAMGSLEVTESSVVTEIIRLTQYEPIATIKCDAIQALAKIKLVNDDVITCLAWAVRFEDEGFVRKMAAQAILTLDLYDNPLVISVVKERIVIDSDESVQTVLLQILDAVGISAETVLEEHPMLMQIKQDVRQLCLKENIIPYIVKTKQKKSSLS